MTKCNCIHGYEPVARKVDPKKHPNVNPDAKYYHACTHKS